MNTYGYVGGNPLNWADPYGLEAVTPTVPGVPGYPIVVPPVAVPGTPENQGFVDMVSDALGNLPSIGFECFGAKCFPVFLNEKADDTSSCPIPGAKPGRKTKGRTKQFEKPGDFGTAVGDFDNTKPTDVKSLPNGGLTGTLPNGDKITVRPGSTDGRPTVEIHSGKRRIKIRYGQ